MAFGPIGAQNVQTFQAGLFFTIRNTDFNISHKQHPKCNLASYSLYIWHRSDIGWNV